MNSIERQEYLIETALKNQFVSIPKTAEKLGVSVETIRRDINILCEKNKLKKVHGGAAPIKSPLWKDGDYFTRIKRNQQGKIAIAMEAAKMIQDGTIVSFDGGATTEMLASYITNVHRVMFVVNSLPIATILVDKINSGEISGTVIMVGGQINSPGYRTYTPMALDTLDKYYCNIAFLSCTALSADGATSGALNTGVYAQHLMRRAATSVLLTDSEKLGKSSLYEFAKLSELDRIIVDDLYPCPPDIVEAVETTNTQLTIVSCQE